jgi:hypothetical protein
VRVAEGVAARGVDVVTFDFPYMASGRKTPDRLPVLLDSFRNVVDHARHAHAVSGHHVFVGGKSMGGRIATHLATEAIQSLRGAIALGYPLHPPGRPDRLRVDHLPDIKVPLLVVQGERDAFGPPNELGPALDAVPTSVTIHAVRDGDHSLKVRKSSGQSQDAVYGNVLDTIADWIHLHAGRT